MTAGRFDALVRELVSLRKGRGIRSPRLVSELGPETRRLLGVQPDDGLAAVTDKLDAAIGTYFSDQPAEGLALRAAFGLHLDAGRSLDERMEWLVQRLGMSSRSARRRIDKAIHLLAEAAITRPVKNRAVNAYDPGYVVNELEVMLRLAGPTARVQERRKIMAVDSSTRSKRRSAFPVAPTQSTSSSCSAARSRQSSVHRRALCATRYGHHLPSRWARSSRMMSSSGCPTTGGLGRTMSCSR